ncbi:MAG: aminoglycoside phosphotransferase family protein [Chloroflexi bacterium]|nr:aminoglycoside phosphotransferase family protein [Chloroflexota bacterium]
MLALDKMDCAEIGRYLAAQGALDSEAVVRVKALGGGVSNIVLMVTTPAQCMVLKQALPELRVEAYWPSRIDRALREAEALRVVAGYLPSGAVPEVHFIDEENFIYGMSCAPESATLWKEDLLSGRVDVPVAVGAGRMLAQMHAIQDPAVKQQFIDDEVFWQLRVDPYYNSTADKHPSLRPVFDHAIAQMKARKLALVHGDYSPKNMFVLREGEPSRFGSSTVARGLVPRSGLSISGAKKMDSRLRGNDGESGPPDGPVGGKDGGHVEPRTGAQVPANAGCEPALPEAIEPALPEEAACVPHEDGGRDQSLLLLDFEVVHWGDPAFDLAFCVNHLLIKSIVNAHVQQDYFQAVSALLAGYRDELTGVDWTEMQAETLRQLGCLMLARIDGKSPVEYITDEATKEIVRRVSRCILHERPGVVDDVYTCIAGEMAN